LFLTPMAKRRRLRSWDKTSDHAPMWVEEEV
jgi:hypothetical protein